MHKQVLNWHHRFCVKHIDWFKLPTSVKPIVIANNIMFNHFQKKKSLKCRR